MQFLCSVLIFHLHTDLEAWLTPICRVILSSFELRFETKKSQDKEGYLTGT